MKYILEVFDTSTLSWLPLRRSDSYSHIKQLFKIVCKECPYEHYRIVLILNERYSKLSGR